MVAVAADAGVGLVGFVLVGLCSRSGPEMTLAGVE